MTSFQQARMFPFLKITVVVFLISISALQARRISQVKENPVGSVDMADTEQDFHCRCCQVHDACYDQIQTSENSVCPSPLSVYLKPYFIEGFNGCGSWNNACQLAICKCDSAAAKCFAKHEYNENFRNYPQSKCE
ncbi:Phospholipase A2, major isoenzyme [Desmophyllum pertusum]|uniref:Phospholipase A2, major isoenzyme n=1 Tax=Desmophyllum pertusum TaxID=174260 RepID=A0A9W9ZYV4_9CNID|nr:Phospholipase A2, major isoenzyme [Desmophyllum pertusum]